VLIPNRDSVQHALDDLERFDVMGFQLDSNCGDAIKFYGNNIEAQAAQAYFSLRIMALQRVKASVIFPKYYQRPLYWNLTFSNHEQS
jgi:hypothetical protein